MQLVTIATFAHIHKLALARGPLEQEGIPCFVKDEYTIQANPLYDIALGGIKLQVPEQDAERARELLRDLGYLNDEDEEPSEFLQTLDRETAKIPLLDKLPFIFRIMVIVVLLAAVLIIALLMTIGKNGAI